MWFVGVQATAHAAVKLAAVERVCRAAHNYRGQKSRMRPVDKTTRVKALAYHVQLMATWKEQVGVLSPRLLGWMNPNLDNAAFLEGVKFAA